MTVSAGNLDGLLGALISASDLYAFHVQSYTTTGSGTSERIATITGVVGDPNFFEGTTINSTAQFTASLFDDSLGTATLSPGVGIDPGAGTFAPSYIFAFNPSSLLLSTLPSFNIALGLDFNLNQDVSLSLFSEQPLTNGTTVTLSAGNSFTDALTLVCYCADTMISTPVGEVAVQTLAPGDLVTTLSGASRAVRWVGFGRVLATRGRRCSATPVIVRKGALADNTPHRDLRLTKGHSIYIDGVLIPVEFLVNHRSILWDDRAQEVEIYHIELDTHDVLIADGAPAESYRDDGNRWLFSNTNSGWHLPPQEPCAPIVTGGPMLDAIWRRLLDRDGPSHRLPLTDDADLHLLADGIRVGAESSLAGIHYFRLSQVPSVLRIKSRAAVPSEIGLAPDSRMLGVAIRSIDVRQSRNMVSLVAADCSLVDGFHAFETENRFCWTDGDAEIPSALFANLTGAVEIALTVACFARYLEDGTQSVAA